MNSNDIDDANTNGTSTSSTVVTNAPVTETNDEVHYASADENAKVASTVVSPQENAGHVLWHLNEKVEEGTTMAHLGRGTLRGGHLGG